MTLALITPTSEAYAESILSQIATPIRAVDTTSLAQARRDYNAWSDNRADLMSAESDGDIPTPDEWHASDDQAVKILNQLAAALGFNAAPKG